MLIMFNKEAVPFDCGKYIGVGFGEIMVFLYWFIVIYHLDTIKAMDLLISA